MPDPVQLAKEARQKLAAALSALQQEGVPDDLVEAAEPIAQAMGVLHRIERSNGQNLEGRKDAVDAVRSALNRVQAIDSPHPAVDVVMESIAASLSRVHALLRIEAPNPAAPAPAAPPAPAPAAHAHVSTPKAAPQPVAVAPAPQPVVTAPIAPVPVVPVAAAQPRPVPQAAPAPVAASPSPKPAPQATVPLTDLKSAGPSFSDNVARDNVRRETPPVLSPQLVQAARSSAAEILRAGASPDPTAPFPAPPPARASVPSSQSSPSSPSSPAAPASGSAASPGASGGARVKVELGTHSSSNFYKGLGGNDVIEHGGIFVATYKALPVNATVTLHVLLPGDLEFTAQAVVQWTREGGSSEPGYGARFTQIAAEGRQLVYRYTRNREPIFYDDL